MSALTQLSYLLVSRLGERVPPITKVDSMRNADAGDLAGQVALVTGARQNVGRAIALHLAALGARVAVNVRGSADRAADVVGTIEASGGRAIAVVGDVSVRSEVEAMVQETREQLGPVSILVNNATPTAREARPLEDVGVAIEESVGTILYGSWYCTQAVLADMREARYGRIVYMSSSSVHIPWNGKHFLAVAKGAVEAMARSLAYEVGRDGITVNALAPGPIGTDSSPRRDQLVAASSIGRSTRVQEIVEACAFLCSSHSGGMTGQVLHCNGGLYFGH